MKARDRLILMGVIVVVVIGGAWMLLVSPERVKATGLNEQVASAKTALSTAEGELSKARTAQSQYTAAYSSVVSLGKAVPATEEEPSLVYEIADAAEHKDVNFEGIHSSSGPGSSSAAASATAASFSTMPFSLSFNGSFFDLEHLLRKLTNFATVTSKGQVTVNGRLLTIQGLNLTGNQSGSSSTVSSSKSSAPVEPELSGTLTVTAYVLPGGQTVTAGATPTAPAGVTPASSTSSSPATPATATVNP